jgi:predicted NACHT family NTPase
VAARKFEQEQYVLFEQGEIQEYIAEYLGISTEDSEAVLDAIEAQHGLLIERAQEFWSFSHLTFQEYFAAKWFCDRADWDGLVSHITEKHWREVFLLAGGMMRTVDKLLQLMKKVIDRHIASDEELQQFLCWLSQKSNSVKLSYKPGAIRAFYLSELNSDINIDLGLDESIDPSFKNVILDKYSFFDANFDDRNWELVLDCALHLDRCPDPPEIALALIFAPELGQSLQELSEQVSERHNNPEKFGKWWRANSQTWREKYRSILMKYRNIGHNWQFSLPQKRLLEQYCYANILLVDCMNSSFVVSDEVRQEIEETLLLPIAEIEERQQRMEVADVGDE